MEGKLTLPRKAMAGTAALAAMLVFMLIAVSGASAQQVGLAASKGCTAMTPLGGTVTCTSTFTNNSPSSGTLGPRVDTITAPASLAGQTGTSPTQDTPVILAPGETSPIETWSFTIPNDPALCGSLVSDTVTATLTLETGAVLPGSASGATEVACGTLTLSKVDQDGNPMSDVLLEVSGPDGAVDTFSCTTDASGSCSLTLAPGEYAVSEPTPPTGYDFVGCTPNPVTVVVGQTATVVCRNQLQTADLTLNKVDQDGAPQADVLLEVSGPDGAATTFSCTTDDTGSCVIVDLVPGVYDVSEPTPPAGYTLIGCDPDPVTVSVDGDNTVTCTNEQIVEFEGCTPGYWKQPQHFDSWVGYSPDDSFEEVFGVDVTLRGNGQSTIDDPTLLEALDANGGGINALARHAVAALLNASNPDVAYEFTEAEIIAMVQEAVESGDFSTAQNLLAAANEAGCPLN